MLHCLHQTLMWPSLSRIDPFMGSKLVLALWTLIEGDKNRYSGGWTTKNPILNEIPSACHASTFRTFNKLHLISHIFLNSMSSKT